MKELTTYLVFSILTIYTSGYVIKVPTISTATSTVIADNRWVHLQKLLIPLFENVCATSTNPVINRLAQDFEMDPTDYLDPNVIPNLQKLKSSGLLPKGTIFSEYNPDHLNELKIIYKVLFYAKNFDTFYKTAAWARQNVNCVLYVNAIYMAIQNRRDTEKLTVPGPYELLPNYFIDRNAIIKATSIFDGEDVTTSESVRYEGNTYTIDANYTALFYNNDDDSKLAYFREDIGLNSYYFIKKLRMLPWYNENIHEHFGEYMYQMLKQLMARYNLERYANGLPEVEAVSWKSPIDFPYDPMLIYSNGNEFDHRTSSFTLNENEDVTLLQTIENNIVTVANHMYQTGYNKTQILNHLMEILITSDRSYDTLARQLLGKDQTTNGCASVLEHYMTSLRDPVFWQINKKIVDMIDEALKTLPVYARNELYFPGVEVVNIDVKKMTTMCDYYDFDVTDALKLEDTKSKFKIKMGQPRLNHKPFTVKINISSLVTQKGMVKIYLGPKMTPGELVTKKNLFFLLDTFEIDLKMGSNIITRSSDDMKQFSEDFMSLDSIRKRVEDAEFGLDSLQFKSVQSQVEYPYRLILPKGTPQGLPIQMFVIVAPFVKARLSSSDSKSKLEFNNALMSPGYPLDLLVEDRQLFELPNVMIKYFTVTQKSDSKIENYGGPGVTKSWYGTDTYDPSARPNYYDKNGQYGGKTDYSVKINEFNVGTNDIILDDSNQEDYYEVIGYNNGPKLHKAGFDYTAKGKKGEFDYKAKKAQYNKKSGSQTKDYTIYRTKKTVDLDLVTTTSSPIEPISTEDNKNFENIIGEYHNVIRDIEIPNENVIGVLEVEPLPLPAMLKKDPEGYEKFDYKSKKTERELKIKVKKTELDKLIKDAKRKGDPVKSIDETTQKKVDEPLHKVELESGVNYFNLDDNILGKNIKENIKVKKEEEDNNKFDFSKEVVKIVNDDDPTVKVDDHISVDFEKKIVQETPMQDQTTGEVDVNNIITKENNWETRTDNLLQSDLTSADDVPQTLNS